MTTSKRCPSSGGLKYAAVSVVSDRARIGPEPRFASRELAIVPGDAGKQQLAQAVQARGTARQDLGLHVCRLRSDARRMTGAKDVEQLGRAQPRFAGPVEQRYLGGGRTLRKPCAARGELLHRRLDPAQALAGALDRGAMIATQAVQHLAHARAVRLGLGAPESEHLSARDRLCDAGARGHLRKGLVDRGVGRRQQEQPFTLREQLLDHVGQGAGLAGAGRTPDERETAIAAQRNGPLLTVIERAVIENERARGPHVGQFAEQRKRALHLMAVAAQLTQTSDQLFVQKPRVRHEHAIARTEGQGTAAAPRRPRSGGAA